MILLERRPNYSTVDRSRSKREVTCPLNSTLRYVVKPYMCFLFPPNTNTQTNIIYINMNRHAVLSRRAGPWISVSVSRTRGDFRLWRRALDLSCNRLRAPKTATNAKRQCIMVVFVFGSYQSGVLALMQSYCCHLSCKLYKYRLT